MNKQNAAIPERWLYWTYQDATLLSSPLFTTDGQLLRILQQGRRNEDNGPDFLDALLEIDGVRCRGDIEFHITPEDWFRHGHDEDARYRNVLAHLVWDAPEGIPQELSRHFPHILIKHHLALPEESWRQKMLGLEQDLRRPAGNFLTPRLSREDVGRYAEQRFARKIERIRSWQRYAAAEDILYILLAEALGFSQNKFPFRQLLRQCPPGHIFSVIPPLHRSPLAIWAYLALRAGFLPAAYSHPSLPAQFREWENHFKERGFHPLLKLEDWHFSRVRPQNSPYVRLAALAQLLYSHQSPTLFQKLLEITMQRLPISTVLACWRKHLQLPVDAQLEALLTLLCKFPQSCRYSIGITRLKQFAVNGLLPLFIAWAQGYGNCGFQAYLYGLLEEFPAAEEVHIIRSQLQFISDRALADRVRRSAYYQQGMLEFMAQVRNT